MTRAERIARALVDFEEVREEMSGFPHPRQGFADEGLTLADKVWNDLRNAPTTKAVRAAQDVEKWIEWKREKEGASK